MISVAKIFRNEIRIPQKRISNPTRHINNNLTPIVYGSPRLACTPPGVPVAMTSARRDSLDTNQVKHIFIGISEKNEIKITSSQCYEQILDHPEIKDLNHPIRELYFSIA